MVGGATKDRCPAANDALETIRKKHAMLRGVLNERAERWWAGSEAIAQGRGGVVLVHEATGISRSTLRRGIREIATRVADRAEPDERIRRPGAGRKRLVVNQPDLLPALKRLVDPATRGDPMSPLLWTSKSVEHLATELQREGHKVSATTVALLLQEGGYSLQSNRKTLEGTSHPDRDGQFQHIAAQSAEFMRAGEPVISVDTKKKELLGPFRNGGREYQAKKRPERVLVHDFKDPELGKAIPYGVYDVERNAGWVNVGVDHDTSEFAVESVRRWWRTMGAAVYPRTKRLLITADGGGSNGYRTRAWKFQLQRLADESGLEITVCHFPPGTSKWNKVEHRLFSYISMNWRGRPLTDYQTVVNLIASTKTKTGLTVKVRLDKNTYQRGIKVSPDELKKIALQPHEFHGEWNYTIKPN